MAWAAFQLVVLEILSIMYTENDCQGLIHHATSEKHLIGHSFIFQPDSGPQNTASAVEACLDRKTHSATLYQS